jgi:ferredoxin
MKIVFDEGACQGHGLCAMTAPDLFDLAEEDGHAIVKFAKVPTQLEEMARRAVDGCPERALSLADAPES